MVKNTPYINVGPGEFIKEEMEIRNWTNEDLSQVLGLNPKTISEILNDQQRITINTAKILSKAFGQSPQYWLNLDNNYRLHLKENNNEEEVEIKSQIYERMPVNDMVKRGWIKKPNDVNELKNCFMNFYNMVEFNFEYLDNQILPATRKSDAFSNFNKYFLLAWTQMAKHSCEKFKVNEFNKKNLNDLAENITIYSTKTNGVSKFLRELTDAGVIFICLSHLPKTYLDGASFLCKDNPVVVYTKRYDRLDNFWFTIAHEIGHILKHIKSEKDIFVDDLKVKDSSNLEKDADDFAEEILKVEQILDYFEGYKHYTSEYRIEEAADELNIHPAIIVGILKYYGILMYNRLNHLNEPISNKIPKKYFVEDHYKLFE